jgi:VanZ family protein
VRAEWPSGRLRLHWLWIAAGAMFMLWGLSQALESDPALHLDFFGGDKLLHVLGSACLMGWWGNVFAGRRARAMAALGCLAYGVLIETLQWLDPPRTADALDLLADTGGIAVALVLLHTPLAGVLAWVERTFARRG